MDVIIVGSTKGKISFACNFFFIPVSPRRYSLAFPRIFYLFLSTPFSLILRYKATMSQEGTNRLRLSLQSSFFVDK